MSASSGGQTIEVCRAHRHHPLFVRAGSIVPLGAPVESTHEKQAIAKIRVYPGADGSFTLFSDDGKTYAYEKGAGSVTRICTGTMRRSSSRTMEQLRGVGPTPASSRLLAHNLQECPLRDPEERARHGSGCTDTQPLPRRV
jgi:alpha-glucosidase (family GH31 glycosyl hydrolase)